MNFKRKRNVNLKEKKKYEFKRKKEIWTSTIVDILRTLVCSIKTGLYIN